MKALRGCPSECLRVAEHWNNDDLVRLAERAHEEAKSEAVGAAAHPNTDLVFITRTRPSMFETMICWHRGQIG